MSASTSSAGPTTGSSGGLWRSDSEWNDWRLIGGGHGIHWEALDEDISVEGLLAGMPSGESERSLEDWLHRRR